MDGDRRGEGPAGFTLVELLVAMVLAAIIGGAVISLLIRQNQFYSQFGEYIYADQTARATGELLAGELQGSGPGDLVAAEADSVSVRYGGYQAVVCSTNPSLNQATLFVYDSATNANLSSTLGYATTAPTDSAWTYDDGWWPNVSISTGAKNDCLDNGAPDEPEAWRYRRLVGWNSTTMQPELERGSIVRKYGQLTFKFAPSSFGSGTALWRNTQELVAPFEADAAFSYVLENGDTVSSPTALADVRAVRITATAVGEEDARVEGTRDLDFTIWLRNER